MLAQPRVILKGNEVLSDYVRCDSDRVTAATAILSSAPALRSCWLNASRYWMGRQVEGSISVWGWIMRRRSWKVGVLGGGVSFFCLGDCRFLVCGALLMLLLPVGGEGCSATFCIRASAYDAPV